MRAQFIFPDQLVDRDSLLNWLESQTPKRRECDRSKPSEFQIFLINRFIKVLMLYFQINELPLLLKNSTRIMKENGEEGVKMARLEAILSKINANLEMLVEHFIDSSCSHTYYLGKCRLCQHVWQFKPKYNEYKCMYCKQYVDDIACRHDYFTEKGLTHICRLCNFEK